VPGPWVSLEDAVTQADVVIIATNHSVYSDPQTIEAIRRSAREDCVIVDVWNALGTGQVFTLTNQVAELREGAA